MKMDTKSTMALTEKGGILHQPDTLEKDSAGGTGAIHRIPSFYISQVVNIQCGGNSKHSIKLLFTHSFICV